MDSISNFFSNIGNGAAELLSNRPAVSQYRPPPPIVQSESQNRPQTSAYNQRPGIAGIPGIPNLLDANGNPVSQFTKAIDEITRNDDYQCIPKVICQMVGSQRRQPTLLNSPIFSA